MRKLWFKVCPVLRVQLALGNSTQLIAVVPEKVVHRFYANTVGCQKTVFIQVTEGEVWLHMKYLSALPHTELCQYHHLHTFIGLMQSQRTYPFVPYAETRVGETPPTTSASHDRGATSRLRR